MATETSVGTPPGDPSPTAPERPSLTSVLRSLLLRLHFYAGVFVAPFLLVAAVSGLLYALSPQAERIVYDHELRVPAGEEELPLSEQIAAARADYPEGEISAIRPSPKEGETTRVLLSGVPGVTEGHTLAVFVDPYTAEVRGALEQYGTSGALPLRTWIDELHRDLHLGQPGRMYSEFAASWLWIITGAGLVLWLGRARARRKVRGTAGRRRLLGLHGTVGVWAAVGLFFISATGLTWSTYAGSRVEELRTSIGQATPVVATDTGHAGHEGHGSDGGHAGHEGHQGHEGHGGASGGEMAAEGVGVDDVLSAARAEGLSNPVELVPPADENTAWVVQQIQRSWPEKQDAAAIDPATGEVLDVVRFADYPLLAKLARWGIDLHMGSLFGLPNQIALALLAVSLITLIVLGYRMWWRRGRAGAFGRPIPRGAWRQMPRPVLLGLVAGLVLLGWFLPLFGIPLAAFLLVDVCLGWRARRRAAAAANGG